FYIFFFQAEDGIRDFHVTGVQTCALPISVLDRYVGTGGHTATDPSMVVFPVTSHDHGGEHGRNTMVARIVIAAPATGHGKTSVRSEERRVGKEGETKARNAEARKYKEQEA